MGGAANFPAWPTPPARRQGRGGSDGGHPAPPSARSYFPSPHSREPKVGAASAASPYPFGRSVTTGSRTSSIVTPPCWNVSRYWFT